MNTINKIVILIVSFGTLVIFSCTKEESKVDEKIEWEYGRNDYNLELGDTLRNFVVHVPEKYSGDEAVPLLIMLHGSSGSGDKFYNISGWVEKADEEGFIAVFPTGLEYPIEGTNRMSTKWSSGGLEDDIPTDYPIHDDVPFFRELIGLCKKSFNINEKRIYMSGFSNGGGFMRSRVIVEMDDIVTAASSGGGLGIHELYTPLHGRTMPLFTISGNRDPKIIEQLAAKQELPFTMQELYAIPEVGPRIDFLVASMNLKKEYSEEPMPPVGNTITFSQPTVDQGQELKIMIVKDLEHNYPNGKNNPQKVNAPDILWPWYMKFTLE